ncbi:MAG: GDSL-type esterase/lipase family protein [Gammaproteobacteria bacterium]|nr:GDSL-type esterase/lipase family protein [Gammaproteobacteria bacterium]
MSRGIAMALALLTTTAVAEYPDPERFRSAIDAFLAADAEAPPPRGAIVATGSSSMRGWHDRIAEDLAPLTIIPRGFGGSNMKDVRHFLAELVLRHVPRAVLLYEGDNDAAAGVPPEQVLAHFDAIAAGIHEVLPRTRIYILAVKPSIRRWNLWDTMSATNAMLADRAARDARLTFIDVATPMLGEDGKPLPEIYVADNLHMNGAGYDIWRDTVRPVLVDAEVGYEVMAGD